VQRVDTHNGFDIIRSRFLLRDDDGVKAVRSREPVLHAVGFSCLLVATGRHDLATLSALGPEGTSEPS
jgi:hypothetical protein